MRITDLLIRDADDTQGGKQSINDPTIKSRYTSYTKTRGGKPSFLALIIHEGTKKVQ